MIDRENEKRFDDRLPLFRRRVFDRDLETFVTVAEEKRRPLSLLMLDLDKFKVGVNDQHGHPIGDEVLLGYAEIVVARTEGKGRAYRHGNGDEVSVLLPNFSTAEGLAVAEELRKSIQSSELSTKALKMTVSVGVATFPDHAEDGQSLVKQADAALYQAKRLGRNLVCVSGDNDCIVLRGRGPRIAVTDARVDELGKVRVVFLNDGGATAHRVHLRRWYEVGHYFCGPAFAGGGIGGLYARVDTRSPDINQACSTSRESVGARESFTEEWQYDGDQWLEHPNAQGSRVIHIVLEVDYRAAKHDATYRTLANFRYEVERAPNHSIQLKRRPDLT